MRKLFHVWILAPLSFIVCTPFYSCSEDDDGGYSKKEKKENTVMYKVYSNTSDVPITISDYFDGPLTIKDYWETEFVTKGYGVQFAASCKDETVLITGEIYVNGKLKRKVEGNKYISVIVNIK